MAWNGESMTKLEMRKLPLKVVAEGAAAASVMRQEPTMANKLETFMAIANEMGYGSWTNDESDEEGTGHEVL